VASSTRQNIVAHVLRVEEYVYLHLAQLKLLNLRMCEFPFFARAISEFQASMKARSGSFEDPEVFAVVLHFFW